MVIKITISNRINYTFIILVIMIFLSIGIYAVVLNPGHSGNQIEVTDTFCELITGNPTCGSVGDPLPTCSNSEILKYDDATTSWKCAVVSETDPTITDNTIKDGISWSEISDIPADFADGTEDIGTQSTLTKGIPIYKKDGEITLNEGSIATTETHYACYSGTTIVRRDGYKCSCPFTKTGVLFCPSGTTIKKARYNFEDGNNGNCIIECSRTSGANPRIGYLVN